MGRFVRSRLHPVPVRSNLSACAHSPTPGMSPTLASCPVCATRIPILILQSHVNACLDTLENVQIPSPPPSDTDTETVDEHSKHPASDNTPRKNLSPARSDQSTNPAAPIAPSTDTTTPPIQNHIVPASSSAPSKTLHQTPISDWLSKIGLSRYTPHILRAGFHTLSDILSVPSPGETLREHGILALGARRKLAIEISALRGETHAQPTPLPTPKPTTQPPKRQKNKSVWSEFFTATTKRTSEIFTLPKRVAKRPRAAKAQQKRVHWYSQRVPGTSFTVDSFKATRGDPAGSIYFLTHFHSDHYGGLSKSALPAGARIVCTSITARLVRSELHIPTEFIVELPLGTAASFGDDSGADVWFFDANHCPGAVVMLFFVRKTKRWVLHSGDCRFDQSVFLSHRKLVEVIRAGELDYLHLDTTYCNPRYVFPHQREVLDGAVRAAREEDTRTRGRCLFFFGTYSVGKEKVFLSVAKALNLKIYTGKRKRSILEKIDLEGLKDRLVESPGDARVHVVSMRALSADGLREYAVRNGLNKDFIGRGLAIVFRPTGWTFRPNGQGFSKINRSTDQAMVYELAYSEHSSYSELVQFVKWAKPARVVPTVNARSREQADELRKLLDHTDKALRAV